MKDSIRKMLSLLLILTVMSMSCTGLFLAKYAKTFAVTDTLRVSFLSDMVNLLPGRVMNTYFDEDTQKIIFGAIVSDLPSTAKLVDPVNKDNYVLVPNTGQTNPAMTFVSGVTPSTFDPLDDTLYINYRANESTDDTGVYVFFDDISNYTYFVSVSRNIKYHFNAENEPDALNPGSVSEYNDFFYGLSSLNDIELKNVDFINKYESTHY